MIYLDNNATTQVDQEVFASMEPYFHTHFANPSSLHLFGHRVSDTIQRLRLQIAEKIGCSFEEIIFTSSGSEANNLCLKGYALANRHKGNHIITTSIEHLSILNTCRYLESQGFDVTYLKVDEKGFVLRQDIQNAIRADTLLISIGHANNEIGTIQPIENLTAVCGRIPFHTDAVQSFLKTDFNVHTLGVCMASFSGHKFHAPKGIGFIYKRKDIDLMPQIHGGQQESDLRAGTENVPYIIGLGKAIERMSSKDITHMKELQTYLFQELSNIEGIRINGPENLEQRICTNVNISSAVLEGETILQRLSTNGFYVSTGSACHSKSSRISHVLESIKCSPRFIHGNIRIGLSKYTKGEDVESFIKKFYSITSEHSSFRLHLCH